MTGNKPREGVTGISQLLLVVCITIWPTATHDEIAHFIYREGGGLISNPVISKRMKELDITRVKVSTEAYQAFLPANLRKEALFWSEPPPVGVVGVRRRQMINVDEFGMELNRTNRKYGWSINFIRIRTCGHYQRTTKLTVLLGIEAGDERLPAHQTGSIENPARWIQVLRGTGTTAEVFAHFMQTIVDSVEERSVTLRELDLPYENERYVLWDNLNSHNSPIVQMVLYGRPDRNVRFSSINRPPYQPKYGPIEYKICDVIHELQMDSQAEWDTDRLEQELVIAATRIGPFDDAFEHCGYTVDGVY